MGVVFLFFFFFFQCFKESCGCCIKVSFRLFWQPTSRVIVPQPNCFWLSKFWIKSAVYPTLMKRDHEAQRLVILSQEAISCGCIFLSGHVRCQMYSTFRQEQTSENIIYKIRKKLKKKLMEVFGKIRFCFLFSKRILHCSVERKKFLILIWFNSRKCKIPLINRRTFEDVFFVCVFGTILLSPC